MAPSSELLKQYDALRDGAGWVDLSDRTQISMTGGDRAKFIHNLCTNDVNSLAAGEGCEAFFTNVQGKILGHGCLYQGQNSLIFDTEPAQAQTLLAHLDRYLIREDVQLEDCTNQWGQILICGVKAQATISSLFEGSIPAKRYSQQQTNWPGGADAGVQLRRAPIGIEDGFTISGDQSVVAAIGRALSQRGLIPCEKHAWEMLRLETGWPCYGRDITDKNLPQEIDRNDLAISFTKGCYLGQETVARIDALGHVNRKLRGFRLTGEQPAPAGLELRAADKVVGWITSSDWSPRLQAPLALGYVRTAHANPGSRLNTTTGDAEVIELPVR